MSSSGGNIPTINRPEPGSDCTNLVVNATLASPRADILAGLHKGDILQITVLTDQGPIQAVTVDGDVAGNIVSRDQVRLLQCIVEGTIFIAEVIQIDGGRCSVQIRAE